MTGRIFTLILLFHVTAYSAYAEVLTLPEGIRLAAMQNRLVRITRAEEDISAADTLLAKAAFFPTVNLSLGHTFLANQPKVVFGGQPVPTSEKAFLSYNLSVEQLLYDFGGRASRYRTSTAALEAKRLETERVLQAVCLEFVFAYFDLLEAEKMALVAGREVERVNAHLRDAQAMYDSGVITRNDLLQAEVRLSDARQRLLGAENNRAVAAARLNVLISWPISAGTRVAEPGKPAASFSLEREAAWEAAVRDRSEARIIAKTMEALHLEESTAEAAYYPRIFIKGMYDRMENRYQVHDDNVSLVLGVTLNLSSGGSTKAEIVKVRHQQRRLAEQREKVFDEIRLEAERAVLNLRHARERLRVAEGAVGQAEENLRINRLRYEEGTGTATEALDAVTLLTTSETNLYRALYDSQRAEAAAYYAIGKDLREVYP